MESDTVWLVSSSKQWRNNTNVIQTQKEGEVLYSIYAKACQRPYKNYKLIKFMNIYSKAHKIFKSLIEWYIITK